MNCPSCNRDTFEQADAMGFCPACCYVVFTVMVPVEVHRVMRPDVPDEFYAAPRPGELPN